MDVTDKLESFINSDYLRISEFVQFLEDDQNQEKLFEYWDRGHTDALDTESSDKIFTDIVDKIVNESDADEKEDSLIISRC